MLRSSSLKIPQKPVVPRLPFEVPSMLNFKKRVGGGRQKSSASFVITFLSRPWRMSPSIPNCLIIHKSASKGGFLGWWRTVEPTVSLRCFRVSSNSGWVGFFSSLNILLFLSFQTFHIMKLGVRAQAKPRNLLSKKFLLQLLRVLMILLLSLSICWKMVVNKFHNEEVKCNYWEYAPLSPLQLYRAGI